MDHYWKSWENEYKKLITCVAYPIGLHPTQTCSPFQKEENFLLISKCISEALFNLQSYKSCIIRELLFRVLEWIYHTQIFLSKVNYLKIAWHHANTLVSLWHNKKHPCLPTGIRVDQESNKPRMEAKRVINSTATTTGQSKDEWMQMSCNVVGLSRAFSQRIWTKLTNIINF